MGTSFEDIMKRMKSTPHVGVPAVTNPKLPTKVERDTEAATVRRRAMPNFHFGTGTKLEQLTEHMKSAPHPTPTCPDPKFNLPEQLLDEAAFEEWDNKFQAFVEKRKAEKAKKKAEVKNS